MNDDDRDTRAEIAPAVVQATAYCGAPAGLSAMTVVQEVFDELDAGAEAP